MPLLVPGLQVQITALGVGALCPVNLLELTGSFYTLGCSPFHKRLIGKKTHGGNFTWSRGAPINVNVNLLIGISVFKETVFHGSFQIAGISVY